MLGAGGPAGSPWRPTGDRRRYLQGVNAGPGSFMRRSDGGSRPCLTARYGVAGKELGYALRHRRRTLHVQQMGDARNRAVLDLREPEVQQGVALLERPDESTSGDTHAA